MGAMSDFQGAGATTGGREDAGSSTAGCHGGGAGVPGGWGGTGQPARVTGVDGAATRAGAALADPDARAAGVLVPPAPAGEAPGEALAEAAAVPAEPDARPAGATEAAPAVPAGGVGAGR